MSYAELGRREIVHRPHIVILERLRNKRRGLRDRVNRDILWVVFEDLWAALMAEPDTFVMTLREFTIFNYFQWRYWGLPVAQRAMERFWYGFHPDQILARLAEKEQAKMEQAKMEQAKMEQAKMEQANRDGKVYDGQASQQHGQTNPFGDGSSSRDDRSSTPDDRSSTPDDDSNSFGDWSSLFDD